MKYEIMDEMTLEDFFLKTEAFAISCGWSVLKRGNLEIYLKNKNGEFFNMCYAENPPYYDKGYYWRFFISGATGFDESKDFFNQPGFLVNNYAPSMELPTVGRNNEPINPFHQVITIGSKFARNCLFAGDETTLIFQPDIGVDRPQVFLTTSIKKSHDFNGGQIVYSDIYAKINSITTTEIKYEWTRKYNSKFPPLGATGYSRGSYGATNTVCCGFTTFLLAGSWHFYWIDFDKTSGNRTPSLPGTRVTTNLNDAQSIHSYAHTPPLQPVCATEITRNIKTSKYTGLNPLITPQYFFLNDIDRWVYAGSLENIRVLPKAGLKNRMILNLGIDKWLVIFNNVVNWDDSVVMQENDYCLAIRLDK